MAVLLIGMGLPSVVTASDGPETREKSYKQEFAVDAGLWISTYIMETSWAQPSGLRDFPTASFDKSVRRQLHGDEVRAADNPGEMAWRRYSDYGIAGMVTGSVATAAAGEGWRSLSQVSRAFAVNNVATTLLKNAVHRSRPKPTISKSEPQDGDNAKSFPSGHSSNAMVAATSLMLLTPDVHPAIHYAIFTLGASVGLGRIMADRHFFTDVLVGAALGVGSTLAVFSSENTLVSVVAGPSTVGLCFHF